MIVNLKLQKRVLHMDVLSMLISVLLVQITTFFLLIRLGDVRSVCYHSCFSLQMLNDKGNTAVYLLYAYTRIRYALQ